MEISLWDENKILIEWRADAQFFTVSTVDEFEFGDNLIKCRQLRVWNRNLELISKCEFLSGIEEILCLR